MTVIATRLLIAVVLCAASGCASLGPVSPLRPLERGIVFQPAKHPAGDWAPTGLAYEDAYFTADDGTQLHGWYMPHDTPLGVALFCHGNAGNITVLAESLRILNERHQLAVLTFDYRGYGRSEGTPSVAGILEDARAARTWLAQRTGVASSDVILMGQSLGGAVAIDLAAKDGARGLVVASSFTSLPDVGAEHVPWLLPHLNMTMRLDSRKKIGQYQGPVLISHGDQDRVIPFRHGERLYAAAHGKKQFFPALGTGHNDPLPENYRLVLHNFLLRLPPTGQAEMH